MAPTITFGSHFVSFLILLFIVTNRASAFGFPSKSRTLPKIEPITDSNIDTDLTALVRVPLDGHSEVYSKALQLLGSMQSAPSCNRLATSRLLTACQSTDGSSSNLEVALDNIKSIYAAQLAVCELRGAGLAIPTHCGTILPSESERQNQRDNGLGGDRDGDFNGRSGVYSKLDNKQLSQCLKSFESKPQWWTSYSNSRQNAVVMCRAARVEIEKDDLIKLHKSLVETSSNLDLALMQALQEANTQLIHRRKFANAVDLFQKKLQRDLELSNKEAQSYLSKLMKSVDSATQTMLSKIASAVKDVETDVARLSQNVQNSKSDAIDLKQNVGRVFQQVLQGSSELAASQTRQWDTNRDLAFQLQNSLETMRGREIDALLGAFGDIHNQIQLSNELVASMYFRQNELDEKLLKLDKSFEKFETKAEAFHALQTLQAETQNGLFAKVQSAMHVTSLQLANINASAAGLQSVVDQTSTKIAQMATFSGFSDIVLRWGWLSLVIFVLYLLYPRYAAYATASIAAFCLLMASLPPLPYDTILIHYASGHSIQVAVLIKAGALLGIILVAVALAQTYRSHLITSKQDLLSSLPNLDILSSRQKHRTWDI